ncbi:MAG: hypothetical protein ACOC2W_00645 [bacterium]
MGKTKLLKMENNGKKGYRFNNKDDFNDMFMWRNTIREAKNDLREYLVWKKENAKGSEIKEAERIYKENWSLI